MAESQIPCSEEEYYYKLDNILLCACQFLRKYFREKWKLETGEDWQDDTEYKVKFLDGNGKNVFKKVPTFQKTIFKEQSIEEWDLQLLSILLQNIGDGTTYKKQNLAVSQLKTIRNELAHHSTNKISSDDYFKKVCVFREIMNDLDMSQQDIDTLVNKAGLSSSKKAKQVMKKKIAKAKAFLESKELEKAIEYFNDAITVPSLPPKHLGHAYEERASCFLSMVNAHTFDQRHVSSALLDSLKALELNEYSCTAHYLTAQCYRMQSKLPKAILHYEKSLSISPGQVNVKADLDSCKNLVAIQNRKDHLNPMLALNLEERVAHYNNETGCNLSKAEFMKINQSKFANIFAKGQQDVFRGHQYFCGWDVPQNYKEAAKYYAKASEEKNLEGMYNLAMCYQHGRGVTQDIAKALKMYTELAEMDIHTPGQVTPTKCNAGVACAQHAIGLMYYDGIGVEQNRREAAIWYKRAMENGIGNSANNLGLMYDKGDGVEHNRKMAEMCWKQAVNFKDVNAPYSLVGYYILELEPDLALEIARTGRQLGNSDLVKMSDRELLNTVNAVRKHRASEEPKVLNFEKEHNLEPKGLTFNERLTRVNKHLDPAKVKLCEVTNDILSKVDNGSWGGKAHPLNWLTILSIQDRAVTGSSTAARIIETLLESNKLIEILERSETYSETEKLTIIDRLYTCATKEFHFVGMSKSLEQRLGKVVHEMFEKHSDRANTNDEKIRFCYAAFNLRGSLKSNSKHGIEILKEGVRRYPNNVYYYDLLSCFLGFKDQDREGILYTQRGLEKFPDYVELQYHLAVHLRFELDKSNEESAVLKTVSEYEKFLSMAPIDHRKYPEAYYQISSVYLGLAMQEELNQNYVNLAEQFFMRGKESEKYQLDCYLPYAESDIKKLTEVTLNSLSKSKQSIPTNESVFVKHPVGILEQKSYLKSPVRKAMILKHREVLQADRSKGFVTTRTPKLSQQAPFKMSVLKPITLQEMNPTQDHIFYNRFLELTIIEDPILSLASILVIAEDVNGDTTRFYLYNIEKNTENLDKLKVGCRLAVLNPYMRIGAQDITHGIRNDEPKCIIYLYKLESICRFCGVENAKRKCSKCKRPYCSRECQKFDWNEFNHKLICK